MFLVSQVPIGEHSGNQVDLDDMHFGSDSGSDIDESEAPVDKGPASPTIAEVVSPTEHASQMLEDVIIFLCRESERQRQGKSRGRKDVIVMRNILLQSLKTLMGNIDPTILDRATNDLSPSPSPTDDGVPLSRVQSTWSWRTPFQAIA